jgi:hypothetical protein
MTAATHLSLRRIQRISLSLTGLEIPDSQKLVARMILGRCQPNARFEGVIPYLAGHQDQLSSISISQETNINCMRTPYFKHTFVLFFFFSTFQPSHILRTPPKEIIRIAQDPRGSCSCIGVGACTLFTLEGSPKFPPPNRKEQNRTQDKTRTERYLGRTL